jgi:ATP-dependent helicase/nuclease subunit B
VVGPGDSDPVEAAEYTTYVRYRELLARLGVEDDAGISVWASRHLVHSNRPDARARSNPQESWTFLEYEESTPAQVRVLEHALRRGGPVHVALTYESDPAIEEVYLAAAQVRARLLDQGFAETEVRCPGGRPVGLRSIESALFRDSPGSEPTVLVPQGLAVKGVPQGEGMGRLVARLVCDLLQGGVPGEEILILFREWNEQADIVVEVLRSWGLNADTDESGSLQAQPAVSALRMAARLPLQEWETQQVVRLLRNGQVRPAWPNCDRLALAKAASIINASPVFRGREQLLRELDRALQQPRDQRTPIERIRQAREIVGQLFGLLGPMEQARPWSGQVAQLRQVAGGLKLDATCATPLDTLWDFLDDYALVLDRLGRGFELVAWSDFVEEVDAIVAETPIDPTMSAWGSVRVTTVGRASGARANHIILADLVEGSFPERGSIEPFLALRAGEKPSLACRTAYGNEMCRFLRVVGSAGSSLTLIYPTTDLKGQELLRAGFLEQFLGRLTPEALDACHEAYSRFHPSLIEPVAMIGTPADARVRAAALASEKGDHRELVRLAQDPLHRPVLEGTAAALRVLQRRLWGTPFSEFEGVLNDPTAIARVKSDLGAGCCFSPSQIETYIACPFHFFSRFVLKLKALEESDELDEDYTRRGSAIHDILERFESLIREPGSPHNVEDLVPAAIDHVLGQGPEQASDLDVGLRSMERRRTERVMAFYLAQREDYEKQGGPRPVPYLLEEGFGSDDTLYPMLEIGGGDRIVKLRGRIDRIDLLETQSDRLFRVIDYKTGSVPSLAEVKRGEMLQLLLYAMAVEKLILADNAARPAGVGYWGLKKDGYKELTFPDWRQVEEELEAHVLGVVDRIRDGSFAVDSRKVGCESYCDYRSVCRIRQVRLAGKRRGEDDDLQLSIQSRRGRTQRGDGGATP